MNHHDPEEATCQGGPKETLRILRPTNGLLATTATLPYAESILATVRWAVASNFFPVPITPFGVAAAAVRKPTVRKACEGQLPQVLGQKPPNWGWSPDGLRKSLAPNWDWVPFLSEKGIIVRNKPAIYRRGRHCAQYVTPPRQRGSLG
jgi:hypothetical protein